MNSLIGHLIKLSSLSEKDQIVEATKLLMKKNQKTVNDLGVTIKRRINPFGVDGVDIDSDTGKESIIMGKPLIRTAYKDAAREITLSHELAEIKSIRRGNMRPLHTHADPSVLMTEADELRKFPESTRKKWMKERRDDIDAVNSIYDDNAQNFSKYKDEELPEFERKMIGYYDSGKDDGEINNAYWKSKAYARSLLYGQYLSDMVSQNVKKHKGKHNTDKDDKTIYGQFHNKLDKRLRIDADKEMQASLDIHDKSKRSAVQGAVIGGVTGGGSIALALQGAVGHKKLIPIATATGIATGAMGGVLGYLMKKDKLIKDRYLND